MLIVKPLGIQAVGYYERGPVPGEWIGSGAAALGLAGPVDPADLRRVLQGCHPSEGRYLPERRPARRRAGWDLVFAAPKSFSLLCAGSGPPGGGGSGRPFREAQAEAVRAVIGYLEDHLLDGGPPGAGPARPGGLVAAMYGHTTNSAAEPHIHSHVILANLGRRPDGSWSPVSSGRWKVARSTLLALYQLELRHRSRIAAPSLQWRVRPDGFPEVISVPRAAVRSASSQGLLAARIGVFAARRQAVAQPRRDRVASSGPSPAELPARGFAADRTGADGAADPHVPAGERDHPERRAVEAWLATRRSAFAPDDVIAALAARCPPGLTARAALEWAEAFCRSSLPLGPDAGARRWTSETARRADDRLVALLDLPAEAQARTPTPSAGSGPAAPPEVLARAILESDAPLVGLQGVPGRSELLAHAEVAEHLFRLGRAAGVPVSVDSPRPGGGERWLALTGLRHEPFGLRSGLLIVDHASRRPTPELLVLASRAKARGNRLVMIEGGTQTHLGTPLSRGLVELTSRSTPLVAAARPWAALEAPCRGVDPPRRGREAAALLVDLALQHPDQPRSGHPLLVGLGPAEVSGLNDAVRARLASRGSLIGEAVEWRGRQFVQGDWVLIVRSGPAGGRGRLGTVADTDPRRGQVAVGWDDSPLTAVLGPSALPHLGHGYAATPALAARTTGRLYLLGRPSAAAQLGPRLVVAAWPGGLDGPGRDLARPGTTERQWPRREGPDAGMAARLGR